MNNNIKRRAIRERIAPKLWDATFINTYNNLKTFLKSIELIYKGSEMKILDIGCGYKPFYYLLTEKNLNFKYVGVDFSKYNSEADIICDCNYDKLPFEDNTFDFIILSEVLEHIYNYENCISEAVRVLKKRGMVFITTPFVFPEHGAPYDFHRYTSFFYRKILQEHGINLLFIKKSGSFFTVPLFTFNILLEKMKLKILSYTIILFNNLLIYSIEVFLDFIMKKFFS